MLIGIDPGMAELVREQSVLYSPNRRSTIYKNNHYPGYRSTSPGYFVGLRPSSDYDAYGRRFCITCGSLSYDKSGEMRYCCSIHLNSSVNSTAQYRNLYPADRGEGWARTLLNYAIQPEAGQAEIMKAKEVIEKQKYRRRSSGCRSGS